MVKVWLLKVRVGLLIVRVGILMVRVVLLIVRVELLAVKYELLIWHGLDFFLVGPSEPLEVVRQKQIYFT